MRKRLQLNLGLSDERGVTAIIVGILMVVFIGIAAVVIDIGYAMVTRNELQNISDGAALAATGWLGDNYSGMTTEELLNYYVSDDEDDIKFIAKAVASQNQAGGVGNIILHDDDIEIGYWENDSRTFSPISNLLEPSQPDAVRVTSRRDASARSANGPISTFFARIFGIDVVSVNATATAAITALSTINKCDLIIPVGISKKWFEPNNCGQPIRFHPTGNMAGCAGWHVFEDWPASASKLRDILEEKRLGNCSEEGEYYNVNDDLYFTFTGGTVASAFDEMEALFEEYAVLDDDGDKEWTTLVAVYDYDDCSNPKGRIKCVGFSTVTITGVSGPGGKGEKGEKGGNGGKGGKTIWGTVHCDQVDRGRGGADLYGTMGSIPGLVQ